MARSWDADRQLLEDTGYVVATVRERPGFVQATVSQGHDRLLIEWDLDRDVAVQLRVVRTEDLPHAPFAKRSGDFVDAEARTGSEAQVADYRGLTAARDG